MKISINKLQQIPRILFTITLFSILAACGGSSSSTPAAPPVDPTDATLKALSLSIGALSPAFSSDVTDYTFTTNKAETTVIAVTNQASATFEIKKTQSPDADASKSIDLTLGNDNTITITVTSPDTKTKKTYKITITRLSTDANLSSLELSTGSLNTAFDSNVTAYTVSTTAKTITVRPAVSDANATVTVNTIATNSGSASAPINLTVGENTINIIVTAEDGITTQTYSIIVTQIDADADARLSALVVAAGALSPAFAEDVTEYTVTTTADTTTTVTTTAKQSAANVTVNDIHVKENGESHTIPLTAGKATPIAVVVTSANGENTKTYNITVNHVVTLELINPNAAAEQKFGEKVVQLANGNIIVNVVGNDDNKGAVYLYKPTSGQVFKSYTGINPGDNFGSGGIILLANNHFLIVSPSADNGERNAAGSVTWVNGSTGDEGTTIRGDSANDTLGSGGVHLLDDNTIIINSPNYKSNGIATGAVMLRTHSGDMIKTLYGNDNTDGFTTTKLGDKGITLLGNGNFVIVSTEHTNKTFANAGLVQLVNSEGKVLKSLTGQGQKPNEYFGGDGITPLKDGNFLIATQTYDASADLTNTGSIHLINGTNGDSISTLIGSKKDGYLGKTSGSGRTSAGNAATTTITPLGNNNYVVLHHTADSPTVPNAGSIRLFNGVDGKEIIFKGTGTGTPVFGSYADDFAKQENFMTKITVLKNHNFVVTAPHSDKQGDSELITSAGSIRLMNGVSGEQLGLQEGEGGNPDYLGNGDTIELSNGKYVVASYNYTSNRINEGLVSVFDDKGKAPEQLVGSKTNDFLGNGGLTALGNNKFVIVSTQIERNSVRFAGSIQLVNASGDIKDANGDIKTGAIREITGDYENDFSGSSVTRLNNHNFVFDLPSDDVDDIDDNIGSVKAVNSTTGIADKSILGLKKDDMKSVQMIRPTTTGDYFILSQPLADDYGSNSGKVKLIVPTF